MTPAAAQLRHGEATGQPAAAVPDGRSAGIRVRRERDGVPGDLTRIGFAEPQPHLHARCPELSEEPGLIRRLRGRALDGAAQHRSRRRW